MPLWYHKTDSYRWINGSIREDLLPDERSVWADFLALAGLTRESRRGYIERSEGIPYRKNHLLSMLNISEELFDRAIDKCVAEGRLQVLPDGTMCITNWGKYNDTSSYEEKNRQKDISIERAKETKKRKSEAVDTIVEVANEIKNQVVKLNKKTRYIDNNTIILDTDSGDIE